MVTVLIAGSRSIMDRKFVERVIFKCPFYNKALGTYFISGGAKGVDTLAIESIKKYTDSYEEIKPDWGKFGKPAGFIRNKVMVKLCDCAIIIWDGESRGTKSTIDLLLEYQKPFILYYYKEKK